MVKYLLAEVKAVRELMKKSKLMSKSIMNHIFSIHLSQGFLNAALMKLKARRCTMYNYVNIVLYFLLVSKNRFFPSNEKPTYRIETVK